MLRPGFLGTLAEWVGGEYNRRVEVMDKAAKRFGLKNILAEVSEEEKARSIIGLFSEWLVFDYHCDHFGGKTGLEFFLIHNRHALSEVDWCAYHEMLAFEVGLFEVLRVEPGRGLVLRSLQNGTECFVEDVSISLSGEPHITLWARIAPVGGIYHIVSHVVRSLPVRFGDGMIKEIRAQKKNTYDAKFAAGLQMKNEEEHDSENLISEQPPSAAQARRAFKEALAYCGMDTFFTLRRFNTWLDEKKYPIDFAIKALLFLIPEEAPEDGMEKLIAAGGDFMNQAPRPHLGGKTPIEAHAEQSAHEELSSVITDTYMRDTYVKDLEKAHGEMRKGNSRGAYKLFANVVERLLTDKVPYFPIFRIYANAAVCSAQEEEKNISDERKPADIVASLGGNAEDALLPHEVLIAAALRINPQYDFGIKMKKKFVADTRDFLAHVPKSERPLITLLKKAVQHGGEYHYRKTVFYRYEKFLKEIGVSLSYRTHTVPTKFRVPPNHKSKHVPRGRNK